MAGADDWEDLELFRALEFYKRGRRQESMRVLREVIRANPRSEQAWLLLAKIVPETDKKIYCFERVLKLNPNNRTAQQTLLALRRYPKSASVHFKSSSSTHKQTAEKETLSGWIVAGILGAGLLVVFGIVVLVVWFSRPSSSSTQTRTVGPITLPPTWTPIPTNTPVPTRTPTPKPSPTSYCPESDVQSYLDITTALLGEIHEENKAMDAVGGALGALSSPRVSSQIAQWTQQHIDMAKKISVPPCLQTAHQFYLNFLQYRYNTFAEAARGHYQSALDWIQKSDVALQQWSRAVDEVVKR